MLARYLVNGRKRSSRDITAEVEREVISMSAARPRTIFAGAGSTSNWIME
jgi:hypothetical protein